LARCAAGHRGQRVLRLTERAPQAALDLLNARGIRDHRAVVFEHHVSFQAEAVGAGDETRVHHVQPHLVEHRRGARDPAAACQRLCDPVDEQRPVGEPGQDVVKREVRHRVGDPRLISLIRRWLKAGVLEDGTVHPSEQGTPQGGSISVLLSNVYLHYVLDLWFERVVKCRLRGEARLVRYIDDFVTCFQYRSDAIRVQDALRLRLGKFSLTLEPTKTKLVEFGRFAQRHAGKHGRNRPETIYFLGLTLYCTGNRKGNFKVGMRTENLGYGAALRLCKS